MSKRHIIKYDYKDDIEYLKNYYNLMNFGGTAHKEEDRA